MDYGIVHHKALIENYFVVALDTILKPVTEKKNLLFCLVVL
jgi:hypothetical protein